jgi:glycerophosphoryl diester phosphodiesterase
MPTDLPPPIVAHRGNAAEYPENTLPALQSALDLGAAYVEFDVQLARDGVPVVIHDADLKRTAGEERGVSDLDGAELAALSVHEPQRFGTRFAGTRIPLLAQVVELLRARDDVTPFIEIKRASITRHGLERTVDAIQQTAAPLRERAVMISFSADAVALCRAKEWRTGAVLEGYDDAAHARLESTRPEFVFCNRTKLPPGDTPLWRGPWQWVIYEVAAPELALALRARGVALFETMQVRMMMASMRKAGS